LVVFIFLTSISNNFVIFIPDFVSIKHNYPMKTALTFHPVSLSLKESRSWLMAGLFIVGNLVLPQLCHLVPNGGLIFLPIYFFTLIAAYKFGLQVGLLTAFFSPVLNSLLFGMPVISLLPIILIKSTLLAIAAAWISKRSRTVSLVLVGVAIIAYQLVGGLAEWAYTSSWYTAWQDIRLGFPGLLIQWIGGWAILKQLASYGK
jgi:hypothetical protein